MATDGYEYRAGHTAGFFDCLSLDNPGHCDRVLPGEYNDGYREGWSRALAFGRIRPILSPESPAVFYETY